MWISCCLSRWLQVQFPPALGRNGFASNFCIVLVWVGHGDSYVPNHPRLATGFFPMLCLCVHCWCVRWQVRPILIGFFPLVNTYFVLRNRIEEPASCIQCNGLSSMEVRIHRPYHSLLGCITHFPSSLLHSLTITLSPTRSWYTTGLKESATITIRWLN